MKNEQFKMIPSVYLILVKNDKILMLRRFNTGFQDGKYSLVAGHLDGKESFMQAIIREAYEEANIKLKKDDLKVIHVMNRFEMQNNKELQERIDVFLIAKKWQNEIKNLEPHKCDNLNWFSLNKLPKNTIPYIKVALDNIKKKIFYSEFGY